jgi:hypothetical protein
VTATDTGIERLWPWPPVTTKLQVPPAELPVTVIEAELLAVVPAVAVATGLLHPDVVNAPL